MSTARENDEILYDVQDGIATITLNRPHEGNAITATLAARVEAVWEDVKDNSAVRVAIVTGAGERHFCTGASVGDLKTDEGAIGLKNLPFAEAVRVSPRQCRVWKPVICAVNGLVNGAGLHFVVDADIVISAATASFMDTHVSIGQVGAIENIGLARRTTLGSALLLTLAGRGHRMTAERAFQLGLVDILEADAAATAQRARALAEEIARNSPQAMALSKRAIWGSMEQGYERALEAGWEILKSQWHHPDFEEGPRAFVERRPPEWVADPNARR